jgi:hypothetical protein
MVDKKRIGIKVLLACACLNGFLLIASDKKEFIKQNSTIVVNKKSGKPVMQPHSVVNIPVPKFDQESVIEKIKREMAELLQRREEIMLQMMVEDLKEDLREIKREIQEDTAKTKDIEKKTEEADKIIKTMKETGEKLRNRKRRAASKLVDNRSIWKSKKSK